MLLAGRSGQAFLGAEMRCLHVRTTRTRTEGFAIQEDFITYARDPDPVHLGCHRLDPFCREPAVYQGCTMTHRPSVGGLNPGVVVPDVDVRGGKAVRRTLYGKLFEPASFRPELFGRYLKIESSCRPSISLRHTSRFMRAIECQANWRPSQRTQKVLADAVFP